MREHDTYLVPEVPSQREHSEVIKPSAEMEWLLGAVIGGGKVQNKG